MAWTPRERMQAVLRGERPDAMAWCGDMTYWHAAHAAIGDLPERWQGKEGRHRLNRELGLSEYVPGCTGGDTVEGDDVRHEVFEAGGRRTFRWHSPVGMIEEVQELPMSKNVRAIVFTNPNEVTVQRVTLPDCGPKEVVCETIYTFVSPGTELRVLSGALESKGRFPLIPGYSWPASTQCRDET